MTNLIQPIPPPPKEIIDASEKGELVIFIGAGASRLVNCLGWDQLASNLIEKCVQVGLINHKTRSKLISINDHRKIISICYTLFEKAKHEDIFSGEMKLALNHGKKEPIPNIYSELVKIKAQFVTTNADEQFDNFFELPNIKYKLSEMDPDNIQSDCLYHIHGSLKDSQNIVFRLSKYFERYNEKHFQQFLANLFGKRTILFIGYGLAEFELLEYLYKNHDTKLPERKHFSLNGYFSGEEDFVKLEQDYYSEMRIEIKPYSLDINGYKQLYYVIVDWVDNILANSTTSFERFKEIDDIIEVE
ncbi:MAG: SIR2 family protein [Ignavibacteriaceae bacterium]|jgi:hypothetical protein